MLVLSLVLGRWTNLFFNQSMCVPASCLLHLHLSRNIRVTLAWSSQGYRLFAQVSDQFSGLCFKAGECFLYCHCANHYPLSLLFVDSRMIVFEDAMLIDNQ